MIDQLNFPLDLIGEAESIQSGLKLIRELKPQLVFLDVELPDGNGFDLLHALEVVDFEIIFITGFNKYAIEAIKHSALDYLVKPFTIKEVKEGLIKAKRKIDHSLPDKAGSAMTRNRLPLPTNFGLTMVSLDEVIYCKGDSSYTTFIMLHGKNHLVSQNLKTFEKMLPDSSFVRIHKSSLVNVNHIINYIKGRGGQVEMVNGHFLDVSRQKKDVLMTVLMR